MGFHRAIISMFSNHMTWNKAMEAKKRVNIYRSVRCYNNFGHHIKSIFSLAMRLVQNLNELASKNCMMKYFNLSSEEINYLRCFIFNFLGEKKKRFDLISGDFLFRRLRMTSSRRWGPTRPEETDFCFYPVETPATVKG